MTGNAVMPFLSRLPAAAIFALIRLYQLLVSPMLAVAQGPNCGCRFAPTCSHYAADAVRKHGALAGSWLALRRFVKCTPLHPGGLDPVPDRVHPSAEVPRSGTKEDRPSAHSFRCVRLTS